jgi:hypothetical protein
MRVQDIGTLNHAIASFFVEPQGRNVYYLSRNSVAQVAIGYCVEMHHGHRRTSPAMNFVDRNKVDHQCFSVS